MSIKPVDFQVLIPKAMEISRASSDDTQKNMALQQQQASAMQHKVDNTLKQVYSRTGPQSARITEKQKEERKGKDGRKKPGGGNSGGNGGKELNNSLQTSTIDIKI